MKNPSRKFKSKWVVAIVGLVPLALGTNPATAKIDSVQGTNHGIESRDAKSTIVPGPTPSIMNGGTCSNSSTDANIKSVQQATFQNVTGLASYKYSTDEPAGQTPNAGVIVIEGRNVSPTSGGPWTYEGPVTVHWEAPTVWDGPLGSTNAAPSHGASFSCTYGYQWPITNASITSIGPGLTCTDVKVGTQGTNTNSYYARPYDPANPLAQRPEIVRLAFPAEKCSIDGNPLGEAGELDNVITLTDHAHAFCGDFNAAEPSDPPNQVGVTHCVSNYQIS